MPYVDRDDRDDPAMGRAGQRLVRGRGGVRVGDRHVRLRLRHQGVRDELASRFSQFVRTIAQEPRELPQFVRTNWGFAHSKSLRRICWAGVTWTQLGTPSLL